LRPLVTGAGGFAGRHLVAHLTDEGDEVLTTDRSSGGPDLLDAEGLTNLIVDLEPEVVYHLAGQSDAALSWDLPLETIRTNSEGTFNLLEAARVAGVDRVVIITSSDVYGKISSDELPVTEDAPLRPVSPYGLSKAMADLIGSYAFLTYGQNVIRARTFNHFGPGQDRNAVCPGLAARIAECEVANGSSIRVGNLDVKRDLTDVRDVVRAYRLLAIKGKPGVAYNVCSGVAISIREVLETLVLHSDRSIRFESDPALFRPVDLEVMYGDGTRIRTDTGWFPERSLEATLLEVLDEWRRRIPEGTRKEEG